MDISRRSYSSAASVLIGTKKFGLWRILLVLVCWLATLQGAVSKPQDKPLRRIDANEFLQLVKSNQRISHRTIPGYAIMIALKWAQETAAQKKALPENGIDVSDCVVEGEFSFRDDDSNPSLFRGLDGKSMHLNTTPVEDLSSDFITFYCEDDISEVIVIPIEVSFVQTQFRSRFFAYHALSSAIFQRRVLFNSVRFENPVNFSHTAFKDSVDFGFSTFSSDAAPSNFDRTVFQKQATFSEDLFAQSASFVEATFWDGGDFGSCHFKKDADFFSGYVTGDMDLTSASFDGPIYFSRSSINGTLDFSKSTISSDAFFIDLNHDPQEQGQATIQFADQNLSGRVYFNNARIQKLLFFPGLDQESSRESASPVSFLKRAVFAGLQCENLDLREAEFRDYADFTDASLGKSANLNNVAFEGGVSFYHTKFPNSSTDISPSGLEVDGVRFSQGFILEWNQVEKKINSRDPETFKRVEDAFMQSKNLEGQNGAFFQRRLLETQNATTWQKLINRFDFFFWGYGVRPMRVLGWMTLLFLAFAGAYWTQTKELNVGGQTLRNAWRRLIFALGFAGRTAWSLTFGYRNSRTLVFRILTIIESVTFKVLFVLLLKAFANTSPLLNELVGKLVHF